MLLFDMGTTYHGYVSDVTCSFPVGGKFTEMQKGIYNVVLKANREVLKELKPGIKYSDMHLLAYDVICSGLKDLGLLQGDLNEMKENHVGSLFMPRKLFLFSNIFFAFFQTLKKRRFGPFSGY